MKKNFSIKRCAIPGSAESNGLRLVPVQLVAALAFTFAATVLVPLQMGQAQRLHVPVKVANVSAQPSANGTVVSIAADGSLGRAQTWQDSEGYHVVIPDTGVVESLKTSRGLKVRQVGTSLEVVLQTKPGAKVSLQPNGNHLSLVTDSKLEGPIDSDSRVEKNSSEEQRLFEEPQQPRPGRNDAASPKLSSTTEDLASNSQTAAPEKPRINPDNLPTVTSPIPTSQPANNGTSVPEGESGISVEGEDGGLLASIFSGTSVFVVFALGLFGLLVSRKLRSRHAPVPTGQSLEGERAQEGSQGTSLQVRGEDTSNSLVRSGDSGSANASRQSVARMPVAGPTSLYGAYRIDQEVGKLVLGQTHRIDVLSSRALDDRRAIETSLIKSVNSPDLDEDARRKAREALEEYGFVARQCASLLLAPDAFERTSAARSLGEIKSPASLPFLLEGLYDSESIVRNQAVVSIGELKLPSAIGALLDIARTHPDVPSALLSRTLSACSVEGLDFFDAVMPEPALLGTGHDTSIFDEITHLEAASAVEALPESSDDERLIHALASLQTSDVEERSAVLKTLVQFRVESAVNAIAAIARHDSESSIRSAAISSLGIINHESVFPSVLIAMSDESREVRAAAARSLNRLSFDRADAYVRVIETCDEETIGNVAKACIKSGIVSQNLDRLASSDRRQAYETFSLICLLAKAKINEPVLHAIAHHPEMDVRLKAVHLLACTGQPEIFEQLRELAVSDGVGEEVKTALLEGMYKLDQAKLKEAEQLKASVLEDEFESVVESEFELQPEAENVESHFEPEIGRELESEFEQQFEPNFEVEVQPKQDELEL